MTDPAPDALVERVFALARLLTHDDIPDESALQKPQPPASWYPQDAPDADEVQHGKPQT